MQLIFLQKPLGGLIHNICHILQIATITLSFDFWDYIAFYKKEVNYKKKLTTVKNILMT